jgi:glycosyltransferase involved in cell wall biosynthesis
MVGGTPSSGAAYGEKIQRLVAALGLEEDVVFTGECDADGDEGSLYLRSADICVLPFDDGVELNRSSVAAAANHGLPILTTRGPDVESAFRDGENVWLVPPRDPEALGDAMETLARDGNRRRRLAEGARRMADAWFSWDASLARTLNALRPPADGRAPDGNADVPVGPSGEVRRPVSGG